MVECCVYAFDKDKSDLVIFNHAFFNDGSKQMKEQKKELSKGLMDGISFFKHTLRLATHNWNPVWLYAYKKSFLLTSLDFMKEFYMKTCFLHHRP